MNVVPGTHSNVLTLGDSEPLLDIEQAARFLNVSETSLRRWTNAGRLACLRVGRRRERRFRKGDLLAFLESEPVGSAPAGEPAVRVMHLCGLYSSDEGQVRQALEFLKEGFPAGSVSYLLFDDATRDRLLGALEGRHPALAADLAEGRLVVSDYAPSVEAQLDWWESNLTAAVRSGATRLRAIGDAGLFARTASPEELVAYEHTWDERFATRFPLVSMCQYDVRVFSGPMILAALKAHPDCFQPHGERILA
jgi:transcriptional repressor of dcmA and dcmR